MAVSTLSVLKVGNARAAKLVLLQSIRVPPHFMAKVFAEREENGDDPLLNAVEGPFSQPYFVGIFSAHRNAEEKEAKVKAASIKPEKLKAERDDAVGKVTARGGKLVAAAHRVLLARIEDKESLAAGVTDSERTRVEQAVAQVCVSHASTHARRIRCAAPLPPSPLCAEPLCVRRCVLTCRHVLSRRQRRTARWQPSTRKRRSGRSSSR